MKPVLIIHGEKRRVKEIKTPNFRALYTENIVEALKVTKYVAPGMVISHELFEINDLQLISDQIFNNPLTPCIPSIFYNIRPDIDAISSYFNRYIPINSQGVFINPRIISKFSKRYLLPQNIGTFN